MEEDDGLLLMRHCKKTSSSSRPRNANAAPQNQKGHAYASAPAHKRSHNLRTSTEIATNSQLNFEEEQFVMENLKRKLIGNQAKPKKLESAKTSPSIIARLMGLKEFPTDKEPEKANKRPVGVLQKPSLSGFLSNRNVEFKDVFEVIEERDRQRDMRQNMKDLMEVKEFESDFENYRDNVVKNIKKSNNPLFAKHLHKLKCYPPHLHKGMVSRLKSGYGHEHVSTKNPKSRNLDQRNNYNHHNHIVVFNSNMGNTDQGPEFQRTVQQNFLENLQNRRNKMWRFETFEHQGGEHCNRSILKLQKLRKADLNSSNEGTKSLAEVLATPDMESFEKILDSRKYHRKNLKSKFAREGYYEKLDGSFVQLPQDVSSVGLKSDFLEREDLTKLRARKHKSRESSINGNFSSRNDLRVVSRIDFETEEKMLFTIDEGQHAGPIISPNFAKGAKKRRNDKRASIEEKDEFFSVLNFSRITNLTEAEIPSPISVLERTPMETASSSSSFWKPESDLHETDTQITEELEACTSSDDDGQGTTHSNKTCTLNLMRDQEEREYLYLLEMLIESGVHRICPGTPQKRCHSREFPVDQSLFDRLEKRYGQMSAWSKSDRRLFFDLVNSVLANVLAPLLDAHPWVRCDRQVGPTWGPEGLVERVWLVLSRNRQKAMTANEEDMVLDLNTFESLGGDINIVGKQIERMLTDEMLEEIVSGFASS